MPSPTETYRKAQDRLAVESLRRMAKLWPLLDPQDLDGTVEAWLAASLDVATDMHDRAVASAIRYYTAARRAAKPNLVGSLPDAVAKLDPQTLVQRLTVSGPVAVKHAMSVGHSVEQATLIGLTRSAQEVAAQTRDAGRGTVMAQTTRDPHATGWARVGGGSECGFCSLLISRGAVYSEDTAAFEAHRNCQCDAEPVFGDSWSGKADAEKLADEWERVTEGASGEDAIRAWNAHRAGRGTPLPRETPKVEPVRLTAAQVAEKARAQTEWAERNGWSTQVDGRTITGSMPDGREIRWELNDSGAWRVASQTKPSGA